MNFIAENDHVMTFANLSDRFQFFLRPHPSDGIVRITKDKKFYLILRNFAFKIIEIHGVMAFFIDTKFAYHKFSFVSPDDIPKRIINGFLNNYCISRLRYRINRSPDCKTDPRRFYMPLGKNFEIMVTLHPSGNSIEESVPCLRIRVSVNILGSK